MRKNKQTKKTPEKSICFPEITKTPSELPKRINRNLITKQKLFYRIK